MLIPSDNRMRMSFKASLSRRVNANSQPNVSHSCSMFKLIKKGEC